MRTRTTWQGKDRETARQAATQRRADDIYDMNFGGPRPQPKADEYMNGGPSDWAEDVAPSTRLEQEYDSKGHVLRDEVGFGEMRADTFKPSQWGDGKYVNRSASERKAVAAHRLATTLLKSEDTGLVRKVALGFMSMPDGALSTALRAVDSTLPKSLPEESRFKRALACTKLAASMLGDAASEASVERLARSIYNIDDPTLRSIVKSVAVAKIAQQQEEQEEEKGETAEEQEEEQQEEEQQEEESQKPADKKPADKKPADKKPAFLKGKTSEEQEEEQQEEGETAEEQEEEQQEEGETAEEQEEEEQEEEQQEEGEHTSEEEQEEEEQSVAEMLKSMTGDMTPQPPAPSIGDMFAPGPAPATPAPAPMPTMAASLEDLFADDPEVQAQREIMAAQRGNEQRFANVGRTASTKGAKKLGSVRASSKSAEEIALESLWK